MLYLTHLYKEKITATSLLMLILFFLRENYYSRRFRNRRKREGEERKEEEGEGEVDVNWEREEGKNI